MPVNSTSKTSDALRTMDQVCNSTHKHNIYMYIINLLGLERRLDLFILMDGYHAVNISIFLNLYLD